MNDHRRMESEDAHDFDEAMKRFFEVEFDLDKCMDWHDSGRTKATSTTFMSDDYDEDFEDMIDIESEPTYLIDTHAFGPAIPFRGETFTSRSSRAWPPLPSEDNLSLTTIFDDPMDIPPISLDLDPPSQRAAYNYSVFDQDCCAMDTSMFNSSSEQVERLPSPTPIKFPVDRLQQKFSHGCIERMNHRRKFSPPCLVGDLNFDSFHVSRPVSSIHFLGKLSSPTEHPLAERVKSGLRNGRDMARCTLKKQAPDTLRVRSNIDTLNCEKVVGGQVGQKRCRRIEPLEKQYVEITDNDVLLGRGGLSNRHPGNIVYRQHILEHQREYKLLKTDEKTEMSKAVVAWVKKRRGRFLKRDENAPGQPYYIATDETARQKVSQALREDHTPEGRQQKKSRTKAYHS